MIDLKTWKLLPGEEKDIITESEQETVALGAAMAQQLVPGNVIGLFGELGTGKTKFVSGVCEGLAVADNVTSPSFTLLNQYNGKMPVYHFDFYRMVDNAELRELGVEEFFYGDGVCLIEWADRIAEWLPEKRIDVFLECFFESGQEQKRKIKFVNLQK